MATCGKKTMCLFEEVHNRMEDVHSLWHSALNSYFDPAGFRAPLQSCITMLRSSTFILQNQKHSIPDFNGWYEPWRARMKNNPLMRWAVDARNKIEKQGDLETYSRVIARIIASYEEEIPEIDITEGLFEPIEALLNRIDKCTLEKQVLEHGLLKIERRWVANTLPDFEILDALAEVYGELSLLLDDAHRQVGLPVPCLVHPEEEGQTPVAGGGPSGGRLPCMIGHDEKRAVIYSIKTGERIVFETEELDSGELIRAAAERYGTTLPSIKTQNDSLIALAESYFAHARAMFLHDGYHISMAFLYKGTELVGQHLFQPEERKDKYLLLRQLATEVDRQNADRVMLIGESWFTTKPLGDFVYPSEVAERREKLHLYASSAQNENVILTAIIVRNGDETSLEETVTELGVFPNILAPIRAIWEKRK